MAAVISNWRLTSPCTFIKLVVLGLLILGFTIAVYLQGDVYHSFRDDIYNSQRKERGSKGSIPLVKNIKIISWTTYQFCCKKHWFEKGHQSFEKCRLPEGSTCEYIRDKSLVKTADAVLFKGTYVRNYKDVPLPRLPNQTWVFFERETPFTTYNKGWNGMDNLFNLTASWSRSSDIVSPYGYCVQRESQKEPPQKITRNYAANKSELVAWYVHNCNAKSKRQDYVREMQKHIPVHIYGCGPYTCKPSMSTRCYELLRERYKFYLAFENSICNDYITEKFWNSLEYDVVPVVYGGTTYKDFAPPHSYIDVRDFKSPKELAEYLLVLGKQDEAYNKYFTWKDKYECHLNNRSQLPCKICSLLHQRRLSGLHKSVNISQVWNPQLLCDDPETFRNTCECWP